MSAPPRRRITTVVLARAAAEVRSALALVAARAATLPTPPNLCSLLAEIASVGGEVTFSPRRTRSAGT